MESKEISGVAANATDPSIWASAGDTIQHDGSLSRHGGITTVKLKKGPDFYLRVTPSEWTEEPPPATAVGGDSVAVFPPSSWHNSGDFGITEEGFVRYWFSAIDQATNIHETDTVAMYFDETGEFWVRSSICFFVRDDDEKLFDFHRLARSARSNVAADFTRYSMTLERLNCGEWRWV